jgi:myo-inositol-1(or 4)-monophosphatase
MTLVTEAVIFASQKHDGMLRKGTDLPYIVHPVEVLAIASALTDDPEILAAAVLHDVIEDCSVTEEELSMRFGARVTRLVLSETQRRDGDPCATWDARKKEAIARIARGGRSVKLIALADKLSNMRAIHRDYDRDSDTMFKRFHQHDKSRHAWYYRSMVSLLKDEFGDTDAWQELNQHVEYVFAGISANAPEDKGD